MDPRVAYQSPGPLQAGPAVSSSSAIGGTRPRGRTDWERPRGLPSKAALSYTKEAITVLVLVLALPWLVGKLVTNPGEVLSSAGRKVVKPGA